MSNRAVPDDGALPGLRELFPDHGAPEFIDPPELDVVRVVEQGDVVMAELTGTAKRAAGGEMRMSMAEVFVMRDGKIAERRAWVIVLQENDYR